MAGYRPGEFAGNQMKLLLGTLVALMGSDGVLSRFLIESGLGSEANVLLGNAVTDESFLIIKLAGGLLAALLLWDFYRRKPAASLVSSLVFVGGYTLIVYWNLLVFSGTMMPAAASCIG